MKKGASCRERWRGKKKGWREVCEKERERDRDERVKEERVGKIF